MAREARRRGGTLRKPKPPKARHDGTCPILRWRQQAEGLLWLELKAESSADINSRVSFRSVRTSPILHCRRTNEARRRRLTASPDMPTVASTLRAGAIEVMRARRATSRQRPDSCDTDGIVPEASRTRPALPGPTSSRSCDAAGMTLDNLVKVTIFLSDRKYIADYRRLRDEALGGRADRADDHHHRHLRRKMAAGDRSCRRRLIVSQRLNSISAATDPTP